MIDDEPQSYAMREIPEDERPRERLVQRGAEALKDAELLAILFRTGLKECNALTLADRLMQQFKDIKGVARASLTELREVKGLGKVKAIEIKAALELGKRLAGHTEPERRKVKSAADVYEAVRLAFLHAEEEMFKVVLLNTKNHIVDIIDVSSGGLDATMATPRDVFRKVVRAGGSAVIVCHNHPSGDPEPSRDDIALTKRLIESADILGIRLLDHIVVGDGRYVSFKERNLM